MISDISVENRKIQFGVSGSVDQVTGRRYHWGAIGLCGRESVIMPFARGFGPMELIIILVIVMIIFGVGRLTEIGGALGKSIKEFRRSSTDGDGSNDSQDTPNNKTTT